MRESAVRSWLKTHKRRVPVRIQLADHQILEGQLYSDLRKSDGTPASIADRLNDRVEPFLPFAEGDTHHLLNKARIVFSELQEDALETPAAEGMRELCIHVVLLTGADFTGTTYAYLPPARSRVLDHLNRLAQDFIPLWTHGHVVLINVAYLVSVTETLHTEREPHCSRTDASSFDRGW